MAVSREQLRAERHAIESRFSTENWSQMNFNERLEACRALELNYAAEKGVAPCEVTYEFMDGSTYGYQCNGRITMNAYVLDEGNFHALIRDENGLVMTDDYGRPMEAVVPVRGSNWATMETVYHEGTHGVQEAEDRLATTYIDSQEDYSLYRIQSCEREAFATGQLRTLEAIQQYQNSTGKMDSEAVNYARSVQANSYQQYHDEAAVRYHDTNIDQTVDQYIADQDNGVVQDNPSESYVAVAQVHQEGLQRLETVSEDQASDYLGSLESDPAQQAGVDYVGLSEDSGISSENMSSSMSYGSQESAGAEAGMGE